MESVLIMQSKIAMKRSAGEISAKTSLLAEKLRKTQKESITSPIKESQIHKAMQDSFGYGDYKSSAQKEAVETVLSGAKNVVVSMATSAGKSLCFQLPCLVQLELKTALVICPTLSLMENQLNFLNKRGLRARAINSSTSYDDRNKICDQLIDEPGSIKFLYLTPEMAERENILDKLFDKKLISRVVIDEAHCVLDDVEYRSSFGKLKELRLKHPEVPFVALTTASDETINEIIEELKMTEDLKTVRSSSVRFNIVYDVVGLDERNFDFLNKIKQLAPDFDRLEPKEMPSGIIYVVGPRDMGLVCEKLEKLNIPSTIYHRNLDEQERQRSYNAWMSNAVPVMVATWGCFGSGIIKECVKFVIHYGIPRNIRSYYQQSGRAGASGELAYSSVYYEKNDLRNKMAMNDYLLTPKCRRQFMAERFGDDTKPCQKYCDNCKA